MTKPHIIYEESSCLFVKYDHPQAHEILEYKTDIIIKSTGKKPITIDLKFTGIFPYSTPMPPEEHTIKAETVIELNTKLTRWFKKFGYILK